MKKALLMALMIFLLASFVSASYGFDAEVNRIKESFEIDAEYGSSEQIELKVINNNGGLDSFCGLQCLYKFNGVPEGNFDFLDNQGDPDIRYYNLDLKEKGKEGAKDNFVFDFQCSISTSGLCKGGSLEKSITLTVNYLLNSEQREAKAFIEGVLVTLNENVKDSDSKIRKVETKLNSLSSNVKVGSLKSDVNSVRNSHNSLKNEVENIDRMVKQDFDYVLAKNIYRNSLPTEITSNGDKAGDIEQELDKLIETHNRISDKINSLGEKNSQVNSKLNLLNEINKFDDDINLLIEDFKLGRFDSYKELEKNINYYDSSLDEVLSATTNKVEELKLTGNSILSNENDRLCEQYEFCLEKKESETIEETCDYFKKLQDDIIFENEKRAKNKTEEKKTEEIKNEKSFLSRIINFFKSILGLISGNVINLIPKEDRIIELSEDCKEYVTNNCNFEIKDYEFDKLEEVNTEVGEITGHGIKETEESAGQCCIGGECTPCCIEESCKTDPSLYPIIFVHGHSTTSWNSLDYSINAFKKFEDKLEEENYVPMGVLLPDSDINKVKEGSWGTIRNPVSIRISYYKGVYDEEGRTIGKEQDQSINVYSQRLSDVVDIVLHHTGKDKVIIVSHSMGGLVSRNYIKNLGGDDKVYKLVTIGTPNHGIYGWFIGGLCGSTHGGLQECKDMQYNSTFLNQLNDGKEVLIPTLAIIGKTPEIEYDSEKNIEYSHDEVVRTYSASLNGAKNVIIEGNCVGALGCSPIDGKTFHGKLLVDPKVYNETINFIKE